MNRQWLCALAGTLLVSVTVQAADKPQERPAHQLMADVITTHIGAGWTKAGAKPAPLASDEEFLRRVYLDLAGRVPHVSETRRFLDDTSADKRAKLVDELLSGPRYVTHWVSVWRSLMMPEAGTSLQARFLVPGFDRWLRDQLSKNVPYDQMVRDLITTKIEPNRNDAFGGGQGPNPVAYYIGKEIKPENLAASTSRLFLGVRLECAQCHDHPFADWKKEQFWTYAAFFSGLSRQMQGDFAVPGREQANKRDITIPGTEKTVQAKFLDGSEPKWKDDTSTRATLAEWLTAGANPYFARATVNRLWAYFYGVGLVDPVDEMVGTDTVASHPQLLDELARAFIANKYDLKFLIKAIVLSRPYQLSSVRTDKSQDDTHLFARAFLRGLTGEQIYDSVAQATGYRDNRTSPDPFSGSARGSAREEFLNKFNGSIGDKSTEVQTSILQALTLMNGRVVSQSTHLQNSETLAAVIDNPFMTTNERIETLFMAALARKPSPKEMARFSRYVENDGASKQVVNEADKKKRTADALADVFWVLLNSGEFILNH